ncbi:MAG: TIGR03013 family PEP-CTERM/XrtA system glycosyltransferase [Burkholderiales bacterium]|nr:TIGR03013 family PEP-CTERM/XrtA system glycosyltransferase [Burkholderiales bacterium]
MVLIFNQRLSLVALLEVALGGAALFVIFGYVMSSHVPVIDGANPKVFGSGGVVFAVSQLAAFGLVGLLRAGTMDRLGPLGLRLLISTSLGAVICHALFGLLPEGELYRESIPQATVMSFAALMLLRGFLLSGVQRNVFSRRILVLGTGTDAAAVARAVGTLPPSEATLVGFYPVDAVNRAVPSDQIIPTSMSLEEAVARTRAQEVIVAVREQRGGSLPLSHLLNCRLRGVRILDLPGFYERVTGEVPVDSLKSSWMIYGDGFRQDWGRRFVKRVFDLSAAMVLLVVTLPVMAIAAIAILLESGRPLIFRQDRVGLGGKEFTVFKFRSMRTDAERDGIPRWATTGDPRITRVGKFLRRTRIDELPQLFNVLRGEMSFVGPRPERAFFVEQLSEKIPFYGARHTVKPGLTGWAQVRYSYGASVEDAVKKLQFDLYYVKNHTLFLDIVILLKTIRVVLKGEGAR